MKWRRQNETVEFVQRRCRASRRHGAWAAVEHEGGEIGERSRLDERAAHDVHAGPEKDAALDPASKLTLCHADQFRLVWRDRPVLTCRYVHQSVELISHACHSSTRVRAQPCSDACGPPSVCVSRMTHNRS